MSKLLSSKAGVVAVAAGHRGSHRAAAGWFLLVKPKQGRSRSSTPASPRLSRASPPAAPSWPRRRRRSASAQRSVPPVEGASQSATWRVMLRGEPAGRPTGSRSGRSAARRWCPRTPTWCTRSRSCSRAALRTSPASSATSTRARQGRARRPRPPLRRGHARAEPPDGKKTFPTVKATVTLDAFEFSGTVGNAGPEHHGRLSRCDHPDQPGDGGADRCRSSP